MIELEASSRPVVLVVEDDAVISSALRMLLDRRGWDVKLAASLHEALDQFEPPPECLIADLMLPDGDGSDLVRLVREKNLPTRVVITTGTQDPVRLKEARALGPDALLEKPVGFNKLLRAMGIDQDS